MGFQIKQDTIGDWNLIDESLNSIDDVSRFLSTYKTRGLSALTARAYAFDLLILYRWLKKENLQFCGLKQSDLLAFIKHQQQSSAKPATINRRLVTAQLYYRFIYGRDLEANSGAILNRGHYLGRGNDKYLGLHKLSRRYKKIKVKLPRTLIEPLSPDQVIIFTQSFKRYRDIAIVYLMLFCGLRSREVLAIKNHDLSLEDLRFKVRGKGNKERMLPLPATVSKAIADYRQYERPDNNVANNLFVILQGDQRGKPMTPSGLRSLFRHYRIKKGIPQANPHRFRHTFGADMSRSGMRLPVLQKLMGHANGMTTLQYINFSMTDLAAEYEKASRLIQSRYEMGEN